MLYVLQVSLLIAALIHIVPLVGVTGAARLDAMYDVAISDPSLELLMQHRAVLFGILGGFLLAAMFITAWQTPAIAAGLISVVSFLLLAYSAGLDNAQIARICAADWVALVCLLVAAGLKMKVAL